jgi:hypothetical protein
MAETDQIAIDSVVAWLGRSSVPSNSNPQTVGEHIAAVYKLVLQAVRESAMPAAWQRESG